ncbi:hypothetical protein PGT21_008735 [Puccinia graminis f. sp. tritici]|uniref:Uncharacterized protein n=1 Tax=Puccinia graminis f. sp. tritici TaxID=56615 RepID=A0A5B0QW09_PUCGR|nr:hypothetical protein PGT21_008735 [Puccinia graminis f. sp. tritici]
MRISMVNTSHSNAWAESADHYHRTAQQGASPSLWWSGLCFGPWQWNCMQFLPCRVLPSAERPGQLPRRPLIKPAEQMGGEPPSIGGPGKARLAQSAPREASLRRRDLQIIPFVPLPMSTAEFPALLSSHTMEAKAITVCELLQSLPCKMTPKSFLLHFLQSDNLDLAYRRRYWAESAVDSTLVSVKATTEAEIPIPQLAEVVSFLGGFDTSLQPYADSSLPTSEKQKQEQASGGAPSLQELKESS